VSSIADRLERARAELWVGRAAELARFRAIACATDEPHLVFVNGPGGIGKTTLLERFAVEAVAAGRRVVRIDARHVGASVDAFVRALGQALGNPHDPVDTLAHIERLALLIDTCEAIAPLEPWLRASFLPALPHSGLVVLAGRDPPSARWRADPGWSVMSTVMELHDLDLVESEELLRRRGVPEAAASTLARASYGHPLALALAAEVARTRPGPSASPALPDDVLRSLLHLFVQDVPSARHRDALRVCAIARATDESLLRHALDDEDVAALFEWLRELPFVTRAAVGLFPHDLARDVLLHDLEQRDAARLRALIHRVREHCFARLEATRLEERNAAAYDLMFAARHWPEVASFLAFRREDAGYTERARPEDAETIVALFAEQEGPQSAAWVSFWWARAPSSFVVFRGSDRELLGALCLLELTAAQRERDSEDPAIAAAWRHVDRHAEIRPDERVLYVRFWGVHGAHQRVSPTQDLVQAHVVSAWVTLPRLAWSFVATLRPEVWDPQFEALGMPAVDTAAFVVDGAPRTVYAHDWRRVPPQQWLRSRPRGSTADTRDAPLARDAFEAAVREALKDFARTRRLSSSPLLHCAALQPAGDVEALRAWIRGAAAELEVHPRDRKLLRALEVTYFKPAPTQESAAERLGVPFGTYRRHLVRGVERLAEILWDRDVLTRR
jgi:hypothetical protein